jgi:hypothetical protein
MNSTDVEKSRKSGYSPLQRAALVLTREREDAVCARISEGGNYRQRDKNHQALLEAVRDPDNTALARAQALLNLEIDQAKEIISHEMPPDVCTAIALISNNKEIGVLAAGKILEKDAILEVAIYAPWPDVRRAAQAKLTAKREIEEALEAETDEELYYALKKALKKFSH